MSIHVKCETETGAIYEAELDRDRDVRLVGGQVSPANLLEVGDEIESHYSNETGGVGHVIVGIRAS